MASGSSITNYNYGTTVVPQYYSPQDVNALLSNPQAVQALDILEQLSQSAYEQQSQAVNNQGAYNSSMNYSQYAMPQVPTYLQQAVPYSSSQAGQFSQNSVATMPNGAMVAVPALAQRLPVMASYGQPATISSDAENNLFQDVDAALGSIEQAGNTQYVDGNGNVITSAIDASPMLTSAEKTMLKTGGMTGPEIMQFMLQKEMEAHAQLVALITNILKMLHDSMMQIINNIRSS